MPERAPSATTPSSTPSAPAPALENAPGGAQGRVAPPASVRETPPVETREFSWKYWAFRVAGAVAPTHPVVAGAPTVDGWRLDGMGSSRLAAAAGGVEYGPYPDAGG